jgi:hypothetical protein
MCNGKKKYTSWKRALKEEDRKKLRLSGKREVSEPEAAPLQPKQEEPKTAETADDWASIYLTHIPREDEEHMTLVGLFAQAMAQAEKRGKAEGWEEGAKTATIYGARMYDFQTGKRAAPPKPLVRPYGGIIVSYDSTTVSRTNPPSTRTVHFVQAENERLREGLTKIASAFCSDDGCDSPRVLAEVAKRYLAPFTHQDDESL